MKTIKYADDQTVLAESEEGLQCMIQSIVRVGKEFAMKVKVGKTKVMRTEKNKIYINLVG